MASSVTARPAMERIVTRAAVQAIELREFRNLRHVTLTLPPDGVAVVGENGHGKTNLLEAIYYLRLLRSWRGAHDLDLVSFGAAGFHLAARLTGGTAHEVSVGFERAGRRKRVRRDGLEPERLSDALGAFPAVVFSPHDAAFVAGAPTLRRRFLDVMLALSSTTYLVALQRYRAALAHRNAALREPGRSGAIEAHAAAWEPALAEHGAILWRARRAWVLAHAERYGELCRAIGERGVASVRYISHLDVEQDDAAAVLRQALESRRALDIRRGLTHAGPHRDDLELTLDDHDLRTYGSAGQHRTAAIALRLLEAATLREATRCEPLVLLDDPFAELDTRRATRILELLEAEPRGQTVLVVPRASDIPSGLTRLERWRITDGALMPSDQ